MLEGDIKLPAVGPVKKEYVVLGGAVIVVFGIAYYRSKKARQAANTAAAGANVGIDPATGYAYGSAEDAAALTNQGSYVTPTPGPSASQNSNPTFYSNAQWAQYARDQLYQNGTVSDTGPLSIALGQYLTGQPPTNDQITLIHMAIAFAGYPPVAGPSGYPPGINTNNAAPPPPTGALPTAPTGLHKVAAGPASITIRWDRLPTIDTYEIHESSVYGSSTRTTNDKSMNTDFVISGLAIDTPHTISVAARNSAGLGPASTITASTTK